MEAGQRKNLLIEPGKNSLVIRFNRPEIRNPLSLEVLAELDAILDGVSASPNLTKIIFTGTGAIFASGANLNEIANVAPDAAREFALRGQSLMEKIIAAGPRTVAAVNGYCFGGALDLALACDTRIASPAAVFCHPGVGLGIITGWGGTQRLPRLIGEAKALEMFLTAKQVKADEAWRMGLVDEIAENLDAKIAELTENQ
jgi:enoyl-CoA hydratase